MWQCRDVLDELKVQLEGVVADSSVYVAFYQAKAEYHKVHGADPAAITIAWLWLSCWHDALSSCSVSLDMWCFVVNMLWEVAMGLYCACCSGLTGLRQVNGPFEEYYHNGLMILAYLPLSEFSLEEQQEMAFMLCVAALVGEGVYSFGELVRR